MADQAQFDLKALFAMAHDLALKGPTIVMLTLGTGMIIAATGARLAPLVQINDDTYNTSIVVGLLLLFFASAIRIYEFKVQTDIQKQMRDYSIKTLQTQQQAPTPPI
jgi:hypothetical protein